MEGQLASAPVCPQFCVARCHLLPPVAMCHRGFAMSAGSRHGALYIEGMARQRYMKATCRAA